MLALPILNVRLNPCHEDWQLMTPTQQGHHCQRCDRVVVDFTTATQADLDAARAASVDGRLCGRFRQEQLAPPQPQLHPKLRRFLLVLVLVCCLGLTGGEAWAQVRKAELNTRFEPTVELQLKTPGELSPLALTEAEEQPLAPQGPLPRQPLFFGMVVEQMPEFKGGIAGLQKYLQQSLKYPAGAAVAGKVFISFRVTKTGAIVNARVVKSLEPGLDTAALRVVRQMPAWAPGQQSGRPTEVNYTLPITFTPR